jgi:ferredoxin
LKHGEGRKWYLRAENYAEDLLSDAKRRRFLENMLTDTGGIERSLRRLDLLAKAPGFIRRILGAAVTRHMKKVHFGQVVPIEEVERILDTVGCVVRVACLCRHVSLGQEKRYCYGLSITPGAGLIGEILDGLDDSFINGPNTGGLERLSRDEALEAMRDHEREGFCHTVWTFHTPFIGGICNCDRHDCLAMHSTLSRGIPMMFRAEYVAGVDPDLCTGCGECIKVCPFDAVALEENDRKAVIDPRRCYGCGICRAACPAQAIGLADRSGVPEAAGLWQ